MMRRRVAAGIALAGLAAFSLMAAEIPPSERIQQWQDAACLFIDNDLGAKLRQDVLQRLQIDAALGDFRRLDVFRQQGIEPRGIAFGAAGTAGLGEGCFG